MSNKPTELSPPPQGIQAATLFVVVLIVGIYVPAIVFCVPAARAFALPAVYVLAAGLAALVAVSFRLMVVGTAPIPVGSFVAGAFLVVGGAGFDIFATILHTPDLRNEGNPIARFLLETDQSTTFVLVYSGICQGLLAVGSVFLWGGLLSHRITIIDSIRAYSLTFPGFLKAILGGGKKTWGQWLVPWIRYPGNRSEKYYYYPWPLAAILVGAGVYRAYLGLEWFGYSFFNRTAVGIGATGLALIAYVTWAWCEVQHANWYSAIVESAQTGSGQGLGESPVVPLANETSSVAYRD